MKCRFKLTPLLLVASIVLSLTLFTIPAHAFPGYYWWYPNNMHVRIYHPASGKYLGIDPNGNEQNGARLQLQDRQDGNQLQIFYLKHIANDAAGHQYYQIRVHGENGKIIEVRNNSTEDWGEVAQWDEHTNKSAMWGFFTETPYSGNASPICCIKNCNSQKLLNVAGGNHYSGNNMIQYHEDGTSSEAFQIINVEDDITGAIWTANWSNRGIYGTTVKNTKNNRQRFNTPITQINGDELLYPYLFNKDKWYLASVMYLDSKLQKEILMMHDEDIFKTIGERLVEETLGTAKESIIDKGLEKTPLGGIPTGLIGGWVDIILAGHDDIQWKRLAEYFKDNTNVRIEIYYKFQGDVGWYTTAYTIVGDKNPVYWSGKKADIDTTYLDSDEKEVSGNIEYFFR